MKLLDEFSDVIEGEVISVRRSYKGYHEGKRVPEDKVIATFDVGDDFDDEEYVLAMNLPLPVGQRIRITKTVRVEVFE